MKNRWGDGERLSAQQQLRMAAFGEEMNSQQPFFLVAAITKMFAAWGPAECLWFNDSSGFRLCCFGNIAQNIQAIFIHVYPMNVFIEHPLWAGDFYVHDFL